MVCSLEDLLVFKHTTCLLLCVRMRPSIRVRGQRFVCGDFTTSSSSFSVSYASAYMSESHLKGYWLSISASSLTEHKSTKHIITTSTHVKARTPPVWSKLVAPRSPSLSSFILPTMTFTLCFWISLGDLILHKGLAMKGGKQTIMWPHLPISPFVLLLCLVRRLILMFCSAA